MDLPRIGDSSDDEEDQWAGRDFDDVDRNGDGVIDQAEFDEAEVFFCVRVIL